LLFLQPSVYPFLSCQPVFYIGKVKFKISNFERLNIMNPIVMKEISMLKIRINELEQKIVSYQQIVQARRNEAGNFGNLMSNSAEIDRNSTVLIGNIASAINFEGISTGLSFVLNDVGANSNVINNQSSDNINNQISEEQLEMERMREEIRELEMRLEGLNESIFF